MARDSLSLSLFLLSLPSRSSLLLSLSLSLSLYSLTSLSTHVYSFCRSIVSLRCWHGAARHGTARHGTARHGSANLARHSAARHGTARHGTARHGSSRSRPDGVQLCSAYPAGGWRLHTSVSPAQAYYDEMTSLIANQIKETNRQSWCNREVLNPVRVSSITTPLHHNRGPYAGISA